MKSNRLPYFRGSISDNVCTDSECSKMMRCLKLVGYLNGGQTRELQLSMSGGYRICCGVGNALMQ